MILEISENTHTRTNSWKVFLVYHSPMFEAWKVPKRPVEVLCDVTRHLVKYWTAVEPRTNSSGMRAHTGQHSQLLSAVHAYTNFCLISCT